MIRSLNIRNYAIIEELEIRFSEGLTIITGETGAGKSILMGALGLIMGKRADTKVLYDLNEKCVVEGLFDVRKYDLSSFFEQRDMDYDEEVVLRREITPSGKSRAFINDSPVTLDILQDLSAALVDLHQQFDTLDIHRVSFQLRMLDALAGNKEALRQYETRYAAYSADIRLLEDLQEKDQSASKELDYLQFQLQELAEAALQAGEQTGLEEELLRLTNAEEIKRTASGIFRHLAEDEQSVIGQLEQMAIALGSLRKVHSAVPELHQRLQGQVYELQDLSRELEELAEGTEFDPARIQEVQQRLDVIYRLQKKHAVASVEELLERQAQLEGQVRLFSDLSASIAELEAGITQQEAELRRLAVGLSEKRQAIAPEFENRVASMLAQLAMEQARLSVSIRALDELTPSGTDEVQFLFAANKGSRLLPIKEVASGGELSRLVLVTKSLVASAIPLPTLIFDEIDTGISGDVALKMGRILRELSNHHQVVSITHSPQVASKADVHYFVYKQDRPDRTVTGVRRLTEPERVEAIATMLSQSPPSASALENARELLKS